MTLKVIHKLKAFSNAISRTFVQHFTRCQLTACLGVIRASCVDNEETVTRILYREQSVWSGASLCACWLRVTASIAAVLLAQLQTQITARLRPMRRRFEPVSTSNRDRRGFVVSAVYAVVEMRVANDTNNGHKPVRERTSRWRHSLTAIPRLVHGVLRVCIHTRFDVRSRKRIASSHLHTQQSSQSPYNGVPNILDCYRAASSSVFWIHC